MARLAEMRVHRAALRHNLGVARRAAPGARVMAAIKAQGYGHGLIRVATALADDTDAFAVASMGEGVALREAGFTEHPVCVLNGPVDAADLDAAAAWRLDPVIHQPWHLEALAGLVTGRPMRVWLKIDSGMGRVGIRPAETSAWLDALAGCPAVARPVGLMTHMACADDRADDHTERQWRCFVEASGDHPGPRSAANSACVMAWPRTHADWIRPGIMLYGCSPLLEDGAGSPALEPAMTLTSRLIAINHLAAGSPVGYGRTWRCPAAMPVGVVGIGYGDGYPRAVPSGTPILVGGRRTTIIGRVSMDKITVDLRPLPAAGIGDEVVLWGRGLPVEEIAAAAGTIGYELLCGVHGRVPSRVD